MKKLLLLALFATSFGWVSAQFSIQKVVIEEYTGAWCQYCADGAVRMEQTLNTYENAIGVSIHVSDAMEIAEGTSLANFYGPAFPQATFNRDGGVVSRGQWLSTAGNAVQGAASVTVALNNVSWDPVTRQISVDLDAQFTGPETGDLRMGVFITEDNINQTGAGYNQANSDNNTVGHPYYQAGNPIVGFNHRHVMRAVLGGEWGMAGIIPNAVNFGSTASHTFTYTLPAGYDENEIHLVGFVSRFDGQGIGDREILNGEEIQLIMPTVAVEDGLDSESDLMSIAPNPFGQRTKVSFSLRESGNIRMEVMNTNGQLIDVMAEGYMNSGLHSLYWDGQTVSGTPAESGLYLIRMVSETGQSMTSKVLLAR